RNDSLDPGGGWSICIHHDRALDSPGNRGRRGRPRVDAFLREQRGPGGEERTLTLSADGAGQVSCPLAFLRHAAVSSASSCSGGAATLTPHPLWPGQHIENARLVLDRVAPEHPGIPSARGGAVAPLPHRQSPGRASAARRIRRTLPAKLASRVTVQAGA